MVETFDPRMTRLQERRLELEQNLQIALAAGQRVIAQQVRAVLALSQTIPTSATDLPYADEVLTPAESRLVMLAHVSEKLSDAQLDRLVEEVKALPHSAARLDILIRLARHLPMHRRHSVVGDVWTEVRRLADPVARARVLFQLAALLRVHEDEYAAPASLLPVLEAAQAINNAEARIRSLTAIAGYLPQALRVRTLHRLLDEIDRLPNDRLRSSAIIALAEQLPAEVEARALRSAESIETPAERARPLISLSSRLSPALQSRLRADALAAVRIIANEEERADALIAFAPLLEDLPDQEALSALREQVRAVIAAIHRRPIRARVLVALARHLTPDLLSEALSITNSLSSEHDRAVLLAELAPSLPHSAIRASVETARAMLSVDSRILALTALAPFAPEDSREQIGSEVLSDVSSLPHPFERVTAMIALTEILPSELHEHVLTMALESALEIENENARARALSLLGPRLPPALLPPALEGAFQFAAPNPRMIALSGLAPGLQGDARHDALAHLLASAREIQLEYKRARALVSIAPLLPVDLLHEVQVAAESLVDPFDRVIVYIAVAQNLPPDQRPPVIAHAWTLIQRIEAGYDAASAITAIAPFLPESARADLAQTASSVIATIRDEYDRASAISILVPLLLTDDQPEPEHVLPDSYLALEEGLSAALDVPYQRVRTHLLEEAAAIWAEDGYFEPSYRLWQTVALRLAELPFADSLLCIGALLPVLRILAGDDEIADIARSLLMR